MFEEKEGLTHEQMAEAKKNVLIRGIIEDTVELLAKEVSNENIERLLGKKFAENFGEGQLIQTRISEAFKGSSVSELETLTMKIATYKDALEK